ncbi:MAG: DNA-directed DNA polymerase epsilon, subunit B [Sclerophora amabilis]|nr:MAG: DNA-directed DNA polymerase epsilon, subunit B [Sclerophora amabilis]
MNGQDQPSTTRTAPIFQSIRTPGRPDILPSSSPAFATPIHPVKQNAANSAPPKPAILPVLLPPPTLRPLAFRTFTKKHNLTLSSSALQSLATFIGKHCGSGWREEGLAEKVLEEVAKNWKKNGGGVIVDGDGGELKGILRNLEGFMHGGKVVQGRGLSRQSSFAFQDRDENSPVPNGISSRPGNLGREDSQSSMGMSALAVEDDDDAEQVTDIRRWMKVIGAFEQPRLTYNVNKKHFERISQPPSLLAPPSHKTHLFRHRYNIIHQRLLRNESFQTSSFAPSRPSSLHGSSSNNATTQQPYKLTPIANLLGRGGSSHILLGLLTIAPAGTLAISDLTGSIGLDVQHAKPVPEDGAWFAPGMIVLVDGMYEEDYNSTNGILGGGDGVGGNIGGTFIAFSMGGPPCERREVTVGISGANSTPNTAGGGFGWVDFLGVGSERALGYRMRRLERRILKTPLTHSMDGMSPESSGSDGRGRNRLIVLGEVTLDNPRTLTALRKVLGVYAAEPVSKIPMSFALIGSFTTHAVMAGGGASGGSIEYKEAFDALASTLSDYPILLQHSTFIFVPGDNDPWASSFSAGAATPLPRRGVPEMFTSRIKRAFASANSEAERSTGTKTDGEAIWTTNPARLSLFGPAHEIVFFRDDMLGRLRRTAIRFQSQPGPRLDAEDEPRTTTPDVEMDIPPANTFRSHPSPTPSRTPNAPQDEAMDLDPSIQSAESHLPSSSPTNPSASSSTPLAPPPNPSHSLHTARKLTKTLLDQGYLSPFPLTTRPVLWDHAPSALSLYPLPTALVLVDAEAPPFAVTYEGCSVLNPGKLVGDGVGGWGRVDADTDGRPLRPGQSSGGEKARTRTTTTTTTTTTTCRWIEYQAGLEAGDKWEGNVRELDL